MTEVINRFLTDLFETVGIMDNENDNILIDHIDLFTERGVGKYE